MNKLVIFLILIVLVPSVNATEQVRVGAECVKDYLPIILGKRVAVLANHTSLIGKTHLVDSLKSLGVDIRYILAPEHGFRGDRSAGEAVGNYTDSKTSIPVVSLYGNSKRPADTLMQKIDVVLFDLQDVGLRYYTYLSTMHYLLEAAAKNSCDVIILDRPNPNGHYIDGPIIEDKHRSFVGIYPVPVVHGMTLGELARMALGEGWVANATKFKLTVIGCQNYTRSTVYNLPVSPSPNLSSMLSIYLYPSMCYFEATPVSLGRGTSQPFLMYGHPQYKGGAHSFTPKEMASAKNPPCKNQLCYGVLLSDTDLAKARSMGINLNYLIDAYKNLNMGNKFFTPFFEKLIGVDYVRKMVIEGRSADEIRACWGPDVIEFAQKRAPYLLYN